MTKQGVALLAGLILLLSFGVYSFAYEPKADVILYNGTVWTVDKNLPKAEAVAILGEKIIGVGSNGEMLKFRGPTTRVIDLKSAFVLPGFNDNHVHFASASNFFWNINLMDVHTDEAFVSRVREYTELRPGEPIRGGGWGAYEQWELGAEKSAENDADEWLPHRKLIDAFTGDIPLFVSRYDRAVYFANTAALRNAGFAEDSADTENIRFVRDRDGRLTGAMEIRNARGVEHQFLGGDQTPDTAKRRLMTENALRLVREAGVTSFQDISDHEQLRIFYDLLDEGRLTARVNFRYGIEHWKKMEALGIKRGFGSSMIRLGAVKGHIDGIMGTSGARFYEPYDSDPEGNNRGHWRPLTWVSPDRRTELNRGPFTQMMIDADAADIQVTVHAIGDEAIGVMLDMIEAMTKANGKRDRRMRLVHAQVFAPRDFARLQDLGVVAEVQPFHLSDDMRWMEERIGRERSKGAYAFKTIRDKGAVLSFGSDWPGTSASYYPINPIYALYAAVTRQTVRRTPAGGWFPDERISIEEAIKAHTWGSSYASFEDGIKGTITVGKLADITVLDKNLLDSDPESWIDDRGEVKVRTLFTIVGGRIVYEQ
ncbi:MAG: amidohydrolase [Acidobacteria bacterium]|nr:MAG: amidohydrolase [Acidobacteriota bacterium]REJ98214.1 MAG: amidohydrolase [Acidobacteriota bacterium]REK16958.1 MAG: amidohydrolase [Acidobacteriota bacterium]REK42868.1 MAG: amidohydrolase [Acidobacteriota bacterium]